MTQVSNIGTLDAMAADETKRRELFDRIVTEQGPALQRLCFGFEAVAARREELLQDILAALWGAIPGFRGDASLRTWTFRVAHNVAASHVGREVRRSDEVPEHPGEPQQSDEQVSVPPRSIDSDLDALRALEKLQNAIGRLRPLDRQIVLLYLEELPQAEIGEITGLSRDNVSTRVSRIKQILSDAMKRSS